jgi:hypothetical protein
MKITPEFYTDPDYLTYMRVICYMCFNISIESIYAIGNNRQILINIITNKNSGNRYALSYLHIDIKKYVMNKHELEELDATKEDKSVRVGKWISDTFYSATTKLRELAAAKWAKILAYVAGAAVVVVCALAAGGVAAATGVVTAVVGAITWLTGSLVTLALSAVFGNEELSSDGLLNFSTRYFRDGRFYFVYVRITGVYKKCNYSSYELDILTSSSFAASNDSLQKKSDSSEEFHKLLDSNPNLKKKYLQIKAKLGK